MTSKIRIRVGAAELEYEGEANFSKSDIKELFLHLDGLAVPGHSHQAQQNMNDAAATQSSGEQSGGSIPGNLHTNSIAAKLGTKSGPELAIAAASRLQLVVGQPSFTRQQLTTDMKSATSYFKQNMLGNLTKILAGLVTAGRLNQVGNGSYSLSAEERQSLEQKLA